MGKETEVNIVPLPNFVREQMMIVVFLEKRNGCFNIITSGTSQGASHKVDHSATNILANGFSAQRLKVHFD